MNKETVEKYLTEKCGITPAPYRVEHNSNKGYCVWGNMPPTCSIQIAECGYAETFDKANAEMFKASFSTLRDWILTAWETSGIWRDYSATIHYRAIKNIESALNKKWDVIKNELEEMV